jgi:hypothetical protein
MEMIQVKSKIEQGEKGTINRSLSRSWTCLGYLITEYSAEMMLGGDSRLEFQSFASVPSP